MWEGTKPVSRELIPLAIAFFSPYLPTFVYSWLTGYPVLGQSTWLWLDFPFETALTAGWWTNTWPGGSPSLNPLQALAIPPPAFPDSDRSSSFSVGLDQASIFKDGHLHGHHGYAQVSQLCVAVIPLTQKSRRGNVGAWEGPEMEAGISWGRY